jgi:hypothetical protein
MRIRSGSPNPNEVCSHAGSEHGSSSTFEYDQEAFETFQLKVIQLCHHIGMGEPSEIDRMKGGSFNRVVGLKFPGRDCVLRIPRWNDANAFADIDDQVAVLRYVSNLLHAPSVVAYDSTTNNPVKSAYVLQDRIGGENVELIYESLSLSEKLQLATIVAEEILKMESHILETPGRLAAANATPAANEAPISPTGDIAVHGFRINSNMPSPTMAIMEKQALPSLMKAMLDHRVDAYGEEFQAEMCKELKNVVDQMEVVGLMRTTDSENIIWHWDFAHRNIMITRPAADKASDTTENGTEMGRSDMPSNPFPDHDVDYATPEERWAITGVLDWDGAMSVPRVLTREPPTWLWGYEENNTWFWFNERERPAARELTNDELLIKAHFDQIMQRASPTYVDDAYCRGRWLRRLFHFALNGWDGTPDWKLYEEFMKEWKEYYAAVSPGDPEMDIDEDDDEDSSENSSEASDGSDEEPDDDTGFAAEVEAEDLAGAAAEVADVTEVAKVAEPPILWWWRAFEALFWRLIVRPVWMG